MLRFAFTVALFGAVILGSSSWLLSAEPSQVTGDLVVSPAAVKLKHHRHPHSIVVYGKTADGIWLDLTAQTSFQSADANIAAVDAKGCVQPKSTGKTQVTASAIGRSVAIPVEVALPELEPVTSYKHEVMPAIAKGGCNTGACHGYSLGKNGFKLSLRGADPNEDFKAITRELSGRRVDLVQPASSLLLTKATGVVGHGGGLRFPPGSLCHQILLSWISQGASADLDDKAELVGIRVFPERLVVESRQKVQLQVLASYSDGTERDVSRLAIYTVNTEGIGEATDTGLVTSGRLGETAVVARFERKFAAARMIVLQNSPGFVPTPVPQENLIDKFVIEKLNDLKVRPSEPSSDAEFLRRIHVDVIGIQPTPDEVRAFLADTDSQKRTKVIEKLLARPEFVDHWSLKWGDLLQNTRTRVSEPAVYAFREWIRSAVASNLPLDQFARELLTSRGGVGDNPAAAYFAISKDTNETLERATQVFCGVRMLCARCHPHPLENWTQVDYYGLHSFFNQVTTKPDQRFPGVPNAKAVLVQPTAGFSTNPRTGQAQPPRFLGGDEPKLDATADRRLVYAQWLAAPENPFFAKSMTNRVWSYFFNRGIIDPVDDLRTTNPPINPALLDALTKDFVEHKFDVRHLMRRIVTSQTYQRSSIANDTNAHDHDNFSHFIPRRLSAETMLDSLVQATGVPESIGGAPAGFSAKQAPDGEIQSEFLLLFGKPQRMEACECERDNDANMLQALHFINGKSILTRVASGNGRVTQLARQKLPNEQLIEELYLWSLARPPSSKELEAGLAFFQGYGDKREDAAQDLMWGLLNSRDLLVH